ncbi:MAG: phosphopantetheine-binding protein [Robiginitalea sp.]|jgi:acyl carrier protein
MAQPKYFEELLEIVKPYLPGDVDEATIRPESRFIDDLNINSSHLVDIVLDVEDRYDIRLEDTEMEEMRSVADAIHLVRTKVNPSQNQG